MEHLKFLTRIILSTAFLFSCSGNNTNNASSSSDKKATQSSTAPSSAANASWSCIIDGQAVSGGQVSSFQGPEGYHGDEGHIVDISQGKELLFYLSDPKSTTTQGVRSLRFAVPDKTGSSSFGPDEDGWGIEVDIKKAGGNEATYFSDSFSIYVATLSSIRTAGTFSGKFKLRDDVTNQDDKKEIEVTDGKFDIPMAKN